MQQAHLWNSLSKTDFNFVTKSKETFRLVCLIVNKTRYHFIAQNSARQASIFKTARLVRAQFVSESLRQQPFWSQRCSSLGVKSTGTWLSRYDNFEITHFPSLEDYNFVHLPVDTANTVTSACQIAKSGASSPSHTRPPQIWLSVRTSYSRCCLAFVSGIALFWWPTALDAARQGALQHTQNT